MDDRNQNSAFLGRLAIAAIIALISLFSYYGHSVPNPVTGKRQHVAMSPDEETSLGLQAAPQMAAQYGGLEPNPIDQMRVDGVGGRIIAESDAKNSPYQFHFHVLRDPKTINAFALPGGQIFITEGLLNKVNLRFGRDDELAADHLGVHFMSQAGFDPRSMIDVMHVLESQGGAPAEFFSTHPNPKHRIGKIQAAIAEEFPKGIPRRWVGEIGRTS